MQKTLIPIFLMVALLMGGNARAQGGPGPWAIAAQALQITTATPALLGFLQKSGQQGADPDFVYGVLGEARRLQDRGLPPDSYLLKANEGLAKGISPAGMDPALNRTRRETEMAGSLVAEAQGRGWSFQNPGERLRTIQEFQWALLNQTPSSVLRRLAFETPAPQYFPHAWKAWKGGPAGPPAWGRGWEKPGRGPKFNHSHNKGPNGAGGRGWGHGKKKF